MEQTFQIHKPTDLEPMAKMMINRLNTNIWAFYGELGAGKTTLIQKICTLLNVKNQVSSPTFNLINEYETHSGQIIYHFDFYRLENEEEALNIGTMEYFDSNNLCLLEWPEKIETLLPYTRTNVYIQIGNKNQRIIKIEQND